LLTLEPRVAGVNGTPCFVTNFPGGPLRDGGTAQESLDRDQGTTEETQIDASDVGVDIFCSAYVAPLIGVGTDKVTLVKSDMSIDYTVRLVITRKMGASGKPALAMTPRTATFRITKSSGSPWDYEAMIAAAQDAVCAIPARTRELPLERFEKVGVMPANVPESEPRRFHSLGKGPWRWSGL
jgi:hypothetical protein